MMAATTAPDVHTVNLMTVQEKLLLSQAVYKLGAVNWVGVSKLLLEHPCCVSRPPGLFSLEACEKSYVALMTSIGQNVPAEDAMKPQAKVHLRLAQTFYIQRMQELKDAVEAQESKFQVLMTEINALRTGDMDAELLGELRGILSKKYGKKNIDAWVPEAVEVKSALANGNEDVEMGDPQLEDEVPPVQIEVETSVSQGQDGPSSEDAVLEAMASPDPVPEIEETVELPVVTIPDDEGTAPADDNIDVQPEVEEAEEVEVVEAEAPALSSSVKSKSKTRASRRTTKARSPTPAATPTPDPEKAAASPARSDLSGAGSDLSPAPSPSPVKDEPSRGTKRKARPSSKAATQPPAKSRAPRGAAAVAAAASPASTTVPDSEMTSDVGEDDEAKPVRETRGRRSKPTPSQPVSSPPKNKGSSPPPAKRAGSVSSQGTEDPAPATRASRRTAKTDTASKLSIVNTAEGDEAAEEEVKEEDEAERTRRAGDKKKKKPAPAVETPVATRTSNRRESTRVARKADDESDGPPDRALVSATPDLVERTEGLQPPRSTRETRTSAPRDMKSNSKFMYSLFDAISQHRNGNIFQNPIKKFDAPDYYEIIKRPTDFKTIRGRIRDGQITTVEEFERDLQLMLSNAMMYNRVGSHVYEKAKEMSEESEAILAQFKSLQHYR